MSTIIPAGRIQLAAFAGRQYAALLRLSGSIELDQTLRELIDVRVSQINGCAFCLDMHWKDARAAGEHRGAALHARRLAREPALRRARARGPGAVPRRSR